MIFAFFLPVDSIFPSQFFNFYLKFIVHALKNNLGFIPGRRVWQWENEREYERDYHTRLAEWLISEQELLHLLIHSSYFLSNRLNLHQLIHFICHWTYVRMYHISAIGYNLSVCIILFRMILETFGDQLITVQELNQLTLANLWKTNQRVSNI